MELIRRYPDQGKGYIFYTDRYYTHTDLIVKMGMNGSHNVGTMRHNYGPHWCDIDKKVKLEPAECRVAQADSPVPFTITAWRDSNAAGSWFVSSCHDGSSSTVNQRRWEGGSKPCPKMAEDYNICMGPVDQHNALRALYSMHMAHHMRWYMSLVYFGLDLLTINSYIWFKEATGTKMNQKDYRLKIIEQKCMELGISTKVHIDEGLPPSAMHRTRLDGKSHFPRFVKNAERRACVVCGRKCSAYCRTCTSYNFGNKVFCCIPHDTDTEDAPKCWDYQHSKEDLKEYHGYDWSKNKE